ncbi:MAG TPA: DUF4149 domain-containing protein [Steroidobacteraceae bacterium]|nr:DUF4149 domain-containing protein [Steroidobacteraceae bacterium]
MIRNGFRVLFVLWAGSLWSLAAWVAPTLFYAQGDRHLAGVLAARLFSIETYIGVGVAVLALLLPDRTKFVWGYLAAALLSINEWALKRIMEQAHSHGTAAGLGFGAWHGVSAALYVLACLAVLRLVWNEDFR